MQDFSQTSSGGPRISVYTINQWRVREWGRVVWRFGGRGRVNDSVHVKGRGRGGVNDKLIDGVDIIDPNRIFTNKLWEKLPSWEMNEMQQRNDRKHDIDKWITDTHNKKRKISSVGITTEKQSVVAETITDFINAQ